jgi:hypothetical protein
VRREDACVAHGVKPRWRYGRGEAAQQRERVEVDGDGAVAERLLQDDAHEPLGAGDHALGRDGRAEHVPEGCLATLRVGSARARGGVEREAVLAHGERSGDDDAWAPLEGELHGATAELGAGGSEAGDRGARELCESGVALAQLFVHAEERVVAGAEHAAAREVAEDARAGDLKRIGHVAGRQVWERTKPELAVRRRDVDSVEEDDVQVRVELQIRRRTLHDDDGAALGALPGARA